jgi:hypothetical protein
MTDHPITPPPELVQEWWDGTHGAYYELEAVSIAAARWGADQELEACCEWLDKGPYGLSIAASSSDLIGSLRAARRPKPPSLKEQALGALNSISGGAVDAMTYIEVINTIRRALEALPE